MKFCINCGKELKEKVKFCTTCGTQQPELKEEKTEEINAGNQHDAIIQDVVAETSVETPISEPIQPEPEPIAEPVYTEPTPEYVAPQQVMTNQTVQQFTKESKNYFSYLNTAIKQPKIGMSESHHMFGLISFVLIAVLNSLAISHALNSIYFFALYTTASTFPLLLPILLWVLVAQFISVLLVYGLTAKVYQSPTSLLESFNKVYSPASMGVYISVVTFIYSFLLTDSVKIFFILLAIPFFLVNASFVGNLWVAKDATNSKNRFYYTLAVLVISLIVQYVVSRIFMDVIADKLNTEQMFKTIISNFLFK